MSRALGPVARRYESTTAAAALRSQGQGVVARSIGARDVVPKTQMRYLTRQIEQGKGSELCEESSARAAC